MLADRVRSAAEKKKGIWVVSSDSEIYSSKDGINWEKTADIYTGQMKYISLVYANLWVVAQENRIITSTNGIDWEIQNTNIDGRIIALAYGNGVWVGVDYYSNKMYISTDLISWESYYISGIYDVSDIDYDNGIFTIIGKNGYATSSDGRNWQTAEFSDSPDLYIVKHLENDVWFIGGDSSSGSSYARYITKAQLEAGEGGVKWSVLIRPRSISGNGEGVYLIGGYRTSYLRRGTNGVGGATGNVKIGGSYSTVLDIEYANGIFALVGSSGTGTPMAKYSADDGLTWANVIGLPVGTLCIKYGGD